MKSRNTLLAALLALSVGMAQAAPLPSAGVGGWAPATPNLSGSRLYGAAADGAGNVVAVGNQLIQISHDDGVSWSNVTGTFPVLSDIHHANGVWLAVGADSHILRSTDGVTWATARSWLADPIGTTQTTIPDLDYDPSTDTWMVSGIGPVTHATSSDNGLTWQAFTPANTHSVNVVTNGSGRWLIRDSYSTSNTLSVSSDAGANWTPEVATTFSAVRPFPNGFIGFAANGEIQTSSNGTSWSISNAAALSGAPLYGISFTNACTDTSGNVLVVGDGGKALYSSNAGASWSSVTTPFTTAISWCSYSGGNWLLNSDTQLEYSADLANWSEVSEAPLAGSLKSVAYANGKWLAVGSNGAVLQSSDGQRWSTLDVGAGTSTLNALAHHGTTWVIAGSNGLAISTDDGQNWSYTTQAKGVAVTYGNGTWLSVVANNIYTSTDNGSSWVKSTNSTPSSASWKKAYWDEASQHFVIFGSSSVAINYSSDGVNWSVATLPGDPVPLSANGLGKIHSVDGDMLVAVDLYNNAVYSSDGGATWSYLLSRVQFQRTDFLDDIMGLAIDISQFNDGGDSNATDYRYAATVGSAIVDLAGSIEGYLYTPGSAAAVAYDGQGTLVAVGGSDIYYMHTAVTAPDNITVVASNGVSVANTDTAVAAFLSGASAVDHAGNVLTTWNDAPTSFPVGTTTVTFGAKNGTDGGLYIENGLAFAHLTPQVRGYASATVTVIVPGPVVTVPGNIVAAAVDASGTPASATAIADFLNSASAVDSNGQPTTVTNNAPSVFPLGDTLVTFSATDVNGTNTASATVSVVDQTAPVIVVNGDSPMTVAHGSVFSDPGANVVDNVDGSFNASVSGTVDTSALGDYLLTYTANDSAHNSATPVTRTVHVTDQSAPVIVLQGDNPTNQAQDTTYQEQGAIVTDNIDTGLSYSVIISGSVDTTTPGQYILTYNVSDSAGNAATPVTRTVNILDVTPPEIVLLGDNPMTVAQGAVFSDPGATVTDNVDTGLTADVVGSIDTGVVGDYTLTYSVSDTAGNDATPVTRTVHVTDQSAPVITLLGDNAMNVVQNDIFIDPGSTVSDNVDIGLVASVGGSVDTSVIGDYTLTYTASDTAGNAATPVTRTIHVTDGSAPVISLNGNSEMTVAQGSVFSDPGSSVSDNIDTNLIASVSGSVNTDSVGDYLLTYTVNDTSGNAATPVTRTVHVTDQTAPVISLSGNSEMTVAQGGSFSDPGTSVSDNVDTGLSASVSGSVNTSAVGNYTITYTVSDSAGNAATPVSRTVHVTDQSAPVIVLLGDSTMSVAQGGSFNDPGAVVTDNVDSSLGVHVSGSVNTSVIGDYLLTYTVSDSAGNAATPVTRTVSVVEVSTPDTSAPVISLLGDNPMTLTRGDSFVDPGASVSDNVDSGLVASISGTVDADTVGDYLLTYTARDSSGNNATPVTRTVNVVAATASAVAAGGGGGGAFGWFSLLLLGLGLFRRRG